MEVSSNSLRVLIIDGNRAAAADTAEVLAACGYWVRCATSAAAVLSAVRSHRFELILADPESVGGNLETMLRQVRMLYPVVAVALSEHSRWMGRGNRPHPVGFDDVRLRKPVTRAAVTEALCHVARNTLPLGGERKGGSLPG